uniref:Protein S-acyltransferase n=1 Tax=Bursaphelenchus xylophilus TaxID=6326 RepID=A0A1I7RUS9_BURXY
MAGLGVCFVWIIGCFIYASQVDPSGMTGVVPAPFIPSRNEHVIENDFCNVCRMDVIFVLFVSSVFIGSSIGLSVCFYGLCLFFHDETSDIPSKFDPDYMAFNKFTWLTLCLTSVFLLAFTAVSTVTLLGFHTILCFQGLSTIDYVQKMRDRMKQKRAKRVEVHPGYDATGSTGGHDVRQV